MQLFINDEKIDIQLGEELYLSDVLDSIESQIQHAGGIISAILVNDKSIDFSNDAWKQIAVHSINTLHIEADAPELTRQKLFDSFLQYLYNIQSFALQKEDTEEQAKQRKIFLENNTLAQELEQLISGIDMLMIENITQHSIRTSLQKAFSLLGLFQSPPQIQYNEEACTILEQSIEHIKKYRNGPFSSIQQWNEAVHSILQQADAIKQLSSIVHSADAMTIGNTVISHIESIDKYLSVIQYPPEHCPNTQAYDRLYSEHTQSLDTIFKELEPAIQHTDWVTVADIMEYEVAALLETYAKTLLHDYGNEP